MVFDMITKKDFTEQVETLLLKSKGTDILGTILKVCELNNVEPESAKRLISDPLKEKLTAEVEKLRLVRRGEVGTGSIDKFMV